MKNIERHDELSDKIFKMGFALHEEGLENDDYVVSSIGDFMVLISGIIHDEDDISLFGELCGMFSAKKILDAQMKMNPLTPKSESEINDLLKIINDSIDKRGDVNDDDDDDVGLDIDIDDKV